ncbi:hypothetical protein M427DRAFT_44423 [Gonapodya prolifera JEL478]|uniref:Uncharacterized protein n=1 Tax=Gonapodya prolifera (strain JEL478) TaxID=1344416 RepID=A0A139AFQ1_GONPJ|nr:hypothetical protein M427DRAFT_44423 [Gonapodya prolifera JEL478]|eukprot:KXS15588.1 hypothetical protein M427DRAFT_44423 [Gonapodya prolifera JEL478]
MAYHPSRIQIRAQGDDLFRLVSKPRSYQDLMNTFASTFPTVLRLGGFHVVLHGGHSETAWATEIDTKSFQLLGARGFSGSAAFFSHRSFGKLSFAILCIFTDGPGIVVHTTAQPASASTGTFKRKSATMLRDAAVILQDNDEDQSATGSGGAQLRLNVAKRVRSAAQQFAKFLRKSMEEISGVNSGSLSTWRFQKHRRVVSLYDTQKIDFGDIQIGSQKLGTITGIGGLLNNPAIGVEAVTVIIKKAFEEAWRAGKEESRSPVGSARDIVSPAVTNSTLVAAIDSGPANSSPTAIVDPSASSTTSTVAIRSVAASLGDEERSLLKNIGGHGLTLPGSGAISIGVCQCRFTTKEPAFHQ